MAHNEESFRQKFYPVSMAHPDFRFLRYAPEEVCFIIDDEFGFAVFSFGSPGHFSSQAMGHQLHAITDAQHRNAEPEHLKVGNWRPTVIYTGRPSGKDDTVRLKRTNLLNGCIKGKYFGINFAFAYPSSYKLGILRAEIKN